MTAGRIVLAALVATLALLATGTAVQGATSGLLRATGFEPGVKLIEGKHTATSYGLGTTSTARAGRQAAVALLKPGDPQWWGGGYRSEFHANDHISSGERWYGISYYFPKDYNQGKNKAFNDRLIYQFTDNGAPVFSLHVDAAKQQLFLRHKRSDGGWQYLGRWKFETNRWYDVAFHVKWSKSKSGLFELYLDGKKVATYTGRTLGARGSTYSKFGIYGQPTKVYIDEFRMASGSNQLKAVSP
ncbi:MAG: polysaccharide lyase [Dehalococcoidia bacterium]|nr:polysaccharide lyase [Dehalococcoidia bacterium]MCA9857182.1 polysaccharide lyase [Dehalococcoidia bacterium]